MARQSNTPLQPQRFGSSPVLSLYRDINRLFDEAFHGVWSSDPTGLGSRFIDARMNVSETSNAFKLTLELPGVVEDDVDISLDDDILTVRGEKRIEKSEEKENFHTVERSFGAFQRSLRLPFATDPEKVAAHFDNGVLTVVVPKTEQQQRSRHIPLQRKQTMVDTSAVPEGLRNDERVEDEP